MSWRTGWCWLTSRSRSELIDGRLNATILAKTGLGASSSEWSRSAACSWAVASLQTPTTAVFRNQRLEAACNSSSSTQAALHTLMQARKRSSENGHQLSLRPGPRAVQRLFELTETLQLFSFDDGSHQQR